MISRRLVLFDIDGTLLYGGSLWRESFEGAFKKCFPGRELIKTGFSGKTDGQIARELIAGTGGPLAGDLDGEARAVLAEYLALASRHIASRAHEIQLLPGAARLVERLKGEAGVTVALLTGNLREGARLKLEPTGLHGHFEFGAYADDHWDRYQLPPIAVGRAREVTGVEFRGKEVVIIGDTIHDVNCGKSIGVRSIAVGTGRGVPREELLAAGPDHYFDDLSDLDRVLRAILG